LEDSKGMAMARFLQVERRLAKELTLREGYSKFMSEYEKLGHMELSNLKY